MINYPNPDKPCGVCKHRWDEHYESMNFPVDNGSKCRIVTSRMFTETGYFNIEECKCREYKEMTNLEYLEYLYDKKVTK